MCKVKWVRPRSWIVCSQGEKPLNQQYWSIWEETWHWLSYLLCVLDSTSLAQHILSLAYFGSWTSIFCNLAVSQINVSRSISYFWLKNDYGSAWIFLEVGLSLTVNKMMSKWARQVWCFRYFLMIKRPSYWVWG